MAIPTQIINDDGSLRAFTPAEVALFRLETRNIRDGSSPVHQFNPEATNSTVTHFIDPAQLENFMAWLLGCVRFYFETSTGKYQLSRLYPQAYPGSTHRVAMDAKVKGFQFRRDDNSGNIPVPEYRKLEVEAVYRTVPFDFTAGIDATNERFRYVEVMPTSGQGEYLALPGTAGYKFLTSDGSPPHGRTVPFNVGRILTTGKISRKWWRIPKAAMDKANPLFKRIWGDADTGARGLIGTVNQYEIHGHRPGTLMLESADTERKIDPVADDWCYNITYHWRLFPDGANSLFSPPSNGPEGFYLAGTGSSWYAPGSVPDAVALYNERDHRALYEVG